MPTIEPIERARKLSIDSCMCFDLRAILYTASYCIAIGSFPPLYFRYNHIRSISTQQNFPVRGKFPRVGFPEDWISTSSVQADHVSNTCKIVVSILFKIFVCQAMKRWLKSIVSTFNHDNGGSTHAGPSLFTHAQSILNHDTNTRVWGSHFGFKKKIGSLSEGRVSVIFISMVLRSIQ
jgi:hypothetical protein